METSEQRKSNMSVDLVRLSKYQIAVFPRYRAFRACSFKILGAAIMLSLLALWATNCGVITVAFTTPKLPMLRNLNWKMKRTI
jgi:hypothetical protein